MKNFVFCTVLPSGASKVDQTHKTRSYTFLPDLTGKCFDRDESCQKWYFINYNLYLSDKLPILHCSTSGSLQTLPNSQIWWLFRSYTVLSHLTRQCFGRNEWCQQCYLQQVWISCMTNSWRCTVFLLGENSVRKQCKLTKKRFFLRNGWFFLRNDWILPISETLGVKTVYPRELIITFKVVYNVVSDNFHFDQNTIQCYWK